MSRYRFTSKAPTKSTSSNTHPWKSFAHWVVNILQSGFFSRQAVVLVNIRTIGQEVSTKKSVGQKELADHDENIENLAAKEAVEVSVILVAKLLVESIQKTITFLLSILNNLGLLVLGKMFHQTSFQGQPESSWEIKQARLKTVQLLLVYPA